MNRGNQAAVVVGVEVARQIQERQARATRNGRRLSAAEALSEIKVLGCGGPAAVALRIRDLQDDRKALGLPMSATDAAHEVMQGSSGAVDAGAAKSGAPMSAPTRGR